MVIIIIRITIGLKESPPLYDRELVVLNLESLPRCGKSDHLLSKHKKSKKSMYAVVSCMCEDTIAI